MISAAELLAWYDRSRRDLPWRRSCEPYVIWLSEVMLQQTRVEVVVPYFLRFLERFPTVELLAEAAVEDVLGHWSGLGYYRRARLLHAAARQIVEEGTFPRTIDALRVLPGVGEYTAAAIGSIAYGLEVPVMDGNVERVMSRFLGSEGDPKRAATRRNLVAGAARFLSSSRPGDSNQALMELGATICTAKSPSCGVCPLSAECRARQFDEPERFPTTRVQRPVEVFALIAAVVEDRGRTLLYRRPEDSSLLAGLWEIPWVAREKSEGREGIPPASLFTRRYGGRWSLGEVVGVVRHSITFRRLVVEVFRAQVRDGGEVCDAVEAGWFGGEDESAIPRSSLVRKILALARSDQSARRSRFRRR